MEKGAAPCSTIHTRTHLSAESLHTGLQTLIRVTCTPDLTGCNNCDTTKGQIRCEDSQFKNSQASVWTAVSSWPLVKQCGLHHLQLEFLGDLLSSRAVRLGLQLRRGFVDRSIQQIYIQRTTCQSRHRSEHSQQGVQEHDSTE